MEQVLTSRDIFFATPRLHYKVQRFKNYGVKRQGAFGLCKHFNSRVERTRDLRSKVITGRCMWRDSQMAWCEEKKKKAYVS